MAVVLFHVQLTFPNAELFVFKFFKGGELGVDLFFVLSGFILAYVYTREFIPGNGLTFTLEFIKARLARIYPLHLVTLLATLVLVVFLPGFSQRYSNYFGPESFILNLLLMQNWGLVGISWNAVSWSISAEWFMYLLFPFLLLGNRALVSESINRQAILIVLALGVLAVHYTIGSLRSWNHYGGTSAGGMIRVFFEFILGFIVCQIRNSIGPCFGRRLEAFTLVSFAAACMAFFVKEYWMLFVPAISMLIMMLSYNTGVVANILSIRPLVYLGDISFSLYMWHWLIIQIHNLMRANGSVEIESRGELFLHTLSMVTLSLIAAAMSYQWIEKPARNWIKKGGHARRAA